MRALAIIAVALLAAAVQGQEPQAVGRQQSAARERMQEVERRLLELSDQLDTQDPARAEALRRALTLSRQQFVVANMAQAESLIQGGDYGAAAQAEQQVLAALGQIGQVLSAEAGEQSVELLTAAEARLADLARRQAQAVAQTQQLPDSPDALRAAADAQHAIAGDLQALLDDLQGTPPSDDLKAALSLVSEAEAALSAGRRAEGLSAQSAAQERLEDAARQLRAAIASRRRADRAQARSALLATLQRMLDEQKAIRAETQDLHSEDAEPAGRAYRLRALALAEREKALRGTADAALDVVVKDGTTVALPAGLRQVRDDVAECARLLGEARTGQEVTTLQEGVESALTALIGAFQAAQQAQAQQRQTPEEEQAEREGRKPPLVELGQQLKVLRALQLGVNAQTERPGSEPAALAERQGALAAAARGLEVSEVADGMEKARALLAQGETGEPVRSVQGEVVARLDALIARYKAQRREAVPGEPKEAAQPNTRGGTQTPVKAAEQSSLPPGDWRQGRLPEAGRLPGDWAPGLPPTEQKRIADTFGTGRLPARYEALLREYNKRLAQP